MALKPVFFFIVFIRLITILYDFLFFSSVKKRQSVCGVFDHPSGWQRLKNLAAIAFRERARRQDRDDTAIGCTSYQPSCTLFHLQKHVRQADLRKPISFGVRQQRTPSV